MAILNTESCLRLAGTYPVGSDGADQSLQAWDILHGNWLLRGWTVGDVSYYSTEIPEYMLIELFRGLGPSVVHVAGAITYTVLVLLAGLSPTSTPRTCAAACGCRRPLKRA